MVRDPSVWWSISHLLCDETESVRLDRVWHACDGAGKRDRFRHDRYDDVHRDDDLELYVRDRCSLHRHVGCFGDSWEKHAELDESGRDGKLYQPANINHNRGAMTWRETSLRMSVKTGRVVCFFHSVG